MCERAPQLAPDEPEALQAMSICLYARDVEGQRALELAQRAVDLAPQEPRFHRQRDNCLFVLSFGPDDILTDRVMQRKNTALARAMESARHTTELFPQDPWCITNSPATTGTSGSGTSSKRPPTPPSPSPPWPTPWSGRRAPVSACTTDVAGMKALLDQVPDRVRSIERTVFSYFLYSAYAGDPQEGIEALRGMTDSWMVDFDFRGPKALPMAVLLEFAGKKELARLQYQEAMAELRRARRRTPPDAQTYLIEAWILHGLDRDEEARTALRVYNESIVRPITINLMAGWWFHSIAANLLIGERATALELMRDVVTTQADGRAVLRGRFSMDRRMAPFRDDPEIKALLAEPGGEEVKDTNHGIFKGGIAGSRARTLRSSACVSAVASSERGWPDRNAMNDAGKAVFLSYASQDAEAAKKICDALRTAGIEVWFDQSELVGGDAWDAKIRKHIKECELLVPIISANTQARTEGYFRLEWRLADQRTHLMAKGRPFLLPVVIDGTRDGDAHVPDSFTEVQWTKLPGVRRLRRSLRGSTSSWAGSNVREAGR